MDIRIMIDTKKIDGGSVGRKVGVGAVSPSPHPPTLLVNPLKIDHVRERGDR
jgi:hypothetical protein